MKILSKRTYNTIGKLINNIIFCCHHGHPEGPLQKLKPLVGKPHRLRQLWSNIEKGLKKSNTTWKQNLARKDGSLGKLCTCLRVAPPPEALRRAGASAKAGSNLRMPNLWSPPFQSSGERAIMNEPKAREDNFFALCEGLSTSCFSR